MNLVQITEAFVKQAHGEDAPIQVDMDAARRAARYGWQARNPGAHLGGKMVANALQGRGLFQDLLSPHYRAKSAMMAGFSDELRKLTEAGWP